MAARVGQRYPLYSCEFFSRNTNSKKVVWLTIAWPGNVVVFHASSYSYEGDEFCKIAIRHQRMTMGNLRSKRQQFTPATALLKKLFKPSPYFISTPSFHLQHQPIEYIFHITTQIQRRFQSSQKPSKHLTSLYSRSSTQRWQEARPRKRRPSPRPSLIILNLGLLPKRRRRRRMAVVLFSDGLD